MNIPAASGAARPQPARANVRPEADSGLDGWLMDRLFGRCRLWRRLGQQAVRSAARPRSGAALRRAIGERGADRPSR